VRWVQGVAEDIAALNLSSWRVVTFGQSFHRVRRLEVAEAVYDLLVPPRTPSGRPIRRTQPVQTINEILSLVARGRIVHPTSSTVPIFNRDDVVLIPIDDLPPLPLGLVWCVSRENPRIRALNEIASSLIADDSPPSQPATDDLSRFTQSTGP